MEPLSTRRTSASGAHTGRNRPIVHPIFSVGDGDGCAMCGHGRMDGKDRGGGSGVRIGFCAVAVHAVVRSALCGPET
jgi:hypothetical protein